MQYTVHFFDVVFSCYVHTQQSTDKTNAKVYNPTTSASETSIRHSGVAADT